MYLNLVLHYMDSKIRTASAHLLRNSFDVGEKGFAYGYLPYYLTLRPPCIREYRYLFVAYNKAVQHRNAITKT